MIEPDPRSCSSGLGGSSVPFTYQVNDPAVYINPNDKYEILVFYTSVRNYQDNFGHIGLAKFDLNWKLKSRNDYFIEGTRVLGGPGFSRPTVYWFEDGGRLYFDSTMGSVNKVGSVKLDNLDQLVNPVVRDENTGGVDIDIPNLDHGKMLMLSGSSWVRERTVGGEWGPIIYNFTKLSGQGWDKDAQGSPQLLVEDDCRIKIYMSGTVMNANKSDYQLINIGMAWPKDDRKFSFEVCKLTKLPGDANGDGKADLFDYDIWKQEYLGAVGETKANFNGDGKVDLFDYDIWKTTYLGR
jgi:hypothetical protein